MPLNLEIDRIDHCLVSYSVAKQLGGSSLFNMWIDSPSLQIPPNILSICERHEISFFFYLKQLENYRI